MARKALYKHATQVNTNTHPDDGTSPVGSNEWNADPDSQGMLGFAPITATVTIASGVATVTDTITVVAAESSTTDTLDKLAIANTSQYDLIYLFADTGDTITLTNTSSPSADGHIKTISNSNETLSTTVPTILIRKGNYWYGYGSSATVALKSPIASPTFTGTVVLPNVPAIVTTQLDLKAPLSSSTLVTPALGTPSAGVLTNCTALPAAQVAQGTMASGMILVAPALGTPASGALTNCTALPAAQVAQGTMASGMILVAPALGTPASGALTNCTALPAAQVTAGTMASGHIIPDPTLTFSINAQTGTTFTPALADAGKIITLNNGSAIAVTIPPNSGVAYPIGSSLTFISIGAGLTTIGQGSGVTIASTGGTATAPIISAQHGSATAIKIATNTWQVIGAIE